jgi:hypothetical protein
MQSSYSKQELDKLKDHAKILYVNDRLTQEEISAKTGVHCNTISRWATAGGWKKLRRNIVLTHGEQIANLLDELIQLNASIREKPEGRQFADSKEADIRRKLVRDIKDLEGSASLTEILYASKGILEFIRKIDLAKAQEIARWIDRYVKSLAEKHGITTTIDDME